MTEEKYTQTVEDLTTATADPNVRYIIANTKGPSEIDGMTVYQFKTHRIEKHPVDNFWYDITGTIYAFAEVHPGDDPRIRCGAGFFSLPQSSSLNELCAPHDFQFSCPVWQAYHTESESNEALEQRMILANHPMVGELFYQITDLLGPLYWDNKETNK